MKLRLAGLSALGLALCLVSPAGAQVGRTAIGEVVAIIDATSYRGETLEVPSEGTSTAEVRSFGPVNSVSIQAHDPESDSIMRNVLSIELTLMGSDASAALTGASVSWWPEGMSEPFYLSEGSGTEVEAEVDSLALESEAPAVQGRFSALVCRADSFFSEVDTGDCRTVEGTFDTALRKAD
ncbi:hypothetical protein [Aquibaculum sediminis]|uniref:hypothetical protein n=1 Tax=Aquibaculum sediminis TaxID=3231907 RepID=UPI003451500B